MRFLFGKVACCIFFLSFLLIFFLFISLLLVVVFYFSSYLFLLASLCVVLFIVVCNCCCCVCFCCCQFSLHLVAFSDRRQSKSQSVACYLLQRQPRARLPHPPLCPIDTWAPQSPFRQTPSVGAYTVFVPLFQVRDCLAVYCLSFAVCCLLLSWLTSDNILLAYRFEAQSSCC